MRLRRRIALCAVGSALAMVGMSSGSAQAAPPLPSTLTGTPTNVADKLGKIIDQLPGLPPITTVAPVLKSLPPVSSLPVCGREGPNCGPGTADRARRRCQSEGTERCFAGGRDRSAPA